MVFPFDLNNFDNTGKLHKKPHQTAEFDKKSYKIKNPPYKVLYDYSYGSVFPVSKSELDCLDVLEFALDKKLKIGVHYCSMENRLSADIYHKNHRFQDNAFYTFSERDFFLKTAKAYGRDVEKVLEVFNRINYNRYVFDKKHEYIEFHVDKIEALKELDIEVGISSYIIETHKYGKYPLELSIDLTYPKSFNLKTDI